MTVVDDNYTGHVEPGTAAKRILPGVSILKTSVGPMDNNAYLVTCSATGETLLIDAANDADVLVELVREHAPKVSLIVTSHQHFDHWQALEALAPAPLPRRSTPSLYQSSRTVCWRAATRCRSASSPSTSSICAVIRQGRSHWPSTVPPPAMSPSYSPATAFSPAASARPGSPATSRSCSRTSPPECSTSTATPPSSTRATVTTPRWAPSARASKSGANGVGE